MNRGECPWRSAGRSHWRDPSPEAGTGGCRCARLSPYSPNDVSPSGGPAVAGLAGATWGRGPRDRCMRRSD